MVWYEPDQILRQNNNISKVATTAYRTQCSTIGEQIFIVPTDQKGNIEQNYTKNDAILILNRENWILNNIF